MAVMPSGHLYGRYVLPVIFLAVILLVFSLALTPFWLYFDRYAFWAALCRPRFLGHFRGSHARMTVSVATTRRRPGYDCASMLSGMPLWPLCPPGPICAIVTTGSSLWPQCSPDLFYDRNAFFPSVKPPCPPGRLLGRHAFLVVPVAATLRPRF